MPRGGRNSYVDDYYILQSSMTFAAGPALLCAIVLLAGMTDAAPEQKRLGSAAKYAQMTADELVCRAVSCHCV